MDHHGERVIPARPDGGQASRQHSNSAFGCGNPQELHQAIGAAAADAQQRRCHPQQLLERLAQHARAVTQLLQATAAQDHPQPCAGDDKQPEGPTNDIRQRQINLLQLACICASAVSDVAQMQGCQLPSLPAGVLSSYSSSFRTWLTAASKAAVAPTNSSSQPAQAPLTPAAAGASCSPPLSPTAPPPLASSADVESTAAAAAGATMRAAQQLWPVIWHLLPHSERAAVLALLGQLVAASPGSLKPPPPSAADTGAAAAAAAQANCTVLALSAAQLLAAVWQSASSSLTPEELSLLRKAQVDGLTAAAQNWKRCWSQEHGQLLQELLSACSSMVQEQRKGWGNAASQLAEAVRRLLMYGVGMQEPMAKYTSSQPAADATASAAVEQPGLGGQQSRTAAAGPLAGTHSTVSSDTATAASSATSKGRSYVPPHLRGKQQGGSGNTTQPQQQQQLPASRDTEWSDVSDWSDVDGATPPGSRRSSRSASAANSSSSSHQRSMRVRAGALQLLQAMVQCDPAALQPYWPSILPSQDPVAPKPLSAHLLTVVLYDPNAKLRALAAASLTLLLEGPVPRGFLAVAEARSMARPSVRGFTTLSTSLGQMLLALHTGLLHALRAESDSAVVSHVLRALAALAAVSPYDRLPPELLPQLVSLLWSYLTALQPQLLAASSPVGPGATAAAAGGGATSSSSSAACASTQPQQQQQLRPGAAASTQLGPWAAASTQLPSSSATAEPASGPQGSQQHAAAAAAGSFTAGLSALAQALSTSKHSSSLGSWLAGDCAAATRTGTNGSSSSSRSHVADSSRASTKHMTAVRVRFNSIPKHGADSSSWTRAGCSGGAGAHDVGSTASSSPLNQGQVIAAGLVLVAQGGVTLDAIEALAALRGLCVQYPHALPPGCWPALLLLAQQLLKASAQPAAAPLVQRSPSRAGSSRQLNGPGRPQGPGMSRAGSSGSIRSEVEVSTSTSSEYRATQHAVRLLGDYLTCQHEQQQQQQQQQQQTQLQGMPQQDSTSASVAVASRAAAAGGSDSSSRSEQQATSPAAATAGPTAAVAAAGAQLSPAAQLHAPWVSLLQLLLVPAVLQHPSCLVRTAVATVLGGVPGATWVQLPSTLQQQLLQALLQALSADPTSAVRAAAAKAAGSVLQHPCVFQGMAAAAVPQDSSSAGADPSVHQPSATSDTGLIAAAISSPAVTEELAAVDPLLLALLQQLLDALQHAPAASISVHAAWAAATAAAAVVQLLPTSSSSSHSTSTGASQLQLIAQAAAEDPEQLPPATAPAAGARQACPVPSQLMPYIVLLAESALAGCRGGDKVRASGVRALGALLGAWSPGWCCNPSHQQPTTKQQQPSGPQQASQQQRAAVRIPQQQLQSGAAQGLSSSWLAAALQQLGSCLGTGNMKVQWNCCCALGAALESPALLEQPLALQTLPPLLITVVQLLSGSSNFKVRSHAAAVLELVPTPELLGGDSGIAEALLTVRAVWKELKGAQHAASSHATRSSSSSGGAAGGAVGRLSSNGRTSSGGASLLLAAGLAGSQQGAGDPDGGDGEVPQFRYLPALLDQLAATCTHLLELLAQQQQQQPVASSSTTCTSQPAHPPWQPTDSLLAQLTPLADDFVQLLQLRLQQLLPLGYLLQPGGEGPEAGASSSMGGPGLPLSAASGEEQGGSSSCGLVKLPSDPWGIEAAAVGCGEGRVRLSDTGWEQLPEDARDALQHWATAAAAVQCLLGGAVPGSDCGQHQCQPEQQTGGRHASVNIFLHASDRSLPTQLHEDTGCQPDTRPCAAAQCAEPLAVHARPMSATNAGVSLRLVLQQQLLQVQQLLRSPGV